MTTVHISVIDSEDSARFIDFSLVSEWIVASNHCEGLNYGASKFAEAWSPETIAHGVKLIDSESDLLVLKRDEQGVCTFCSSVR